MEKAKWDQYYSKLAPDYVSAGTSPLDAEIQGICSGLLPAGGRVLEAGCGSGSHSLALARTGRFQTTLLDFSPAALSYAQRLFARDAMRAEFIESDLARPGSPDFDLVFNAGVLEHYSREEQIALLRGMKSRSRRYVLAMVPNSRCYWYWIWRLHRSASGDWPWGKEVPLAALDDLFAAAGIHFLGRCYLGESATEAFVSELPGLDAALREQILAVHRSQLVPAADRAYLVAALGSVEPLEAPEGWSRAAVEAGRSETLAAALADSLAAGTSERAARTRLEKRLAENDARFAEERKRLIDLVDAVSGQVAELQQERRAGEEARAAMQAQLSALEAREQALIGETRAQSEAIRSLTTRNDELQAAVTSLNQDLRAQAAMDRFAARFETQLSLLRGQRAWKLMLAVRKAYTLWMHRGLAGKLAALKIPFEILRGETFSAFEPPFPSVWDYAHSAPQECLPAPSPAAEKLAVIILPVFDFEFRFQRPQQIAAHLALMGHPVYWVSPSRMLPEDAPAKFETVQLREMLHEVRLACAPVDLYTGELSAAHARRIADCLAELCRERGIAAAAVLVQFPFWRQAAEELRARCGARIIYDCMDDWRNWTATPAIHPFSLREERELARGCDLLTATSAELQQRLERETGRSALRLRNGVDFEFFRAAPESDVLPGIPGPVIGYYGAIADWVDLELLTAAAALRPQYSFVIIGEVHDVDVSALRKLPNVHLPGEKHYRVIRSFLRRFDVCLLPFRLNTLTRAVDPVKVYEYLSQGKPVVATPLPEVRDHGGLVYFAKTAEQFAAQIDLALAESDPALREARAAYAASQSWLERTSALTTALAASFPLVSILVISYNSEEYLGPLLDSIFRHTDWPRYEVIAVDNDSSDRSRDVLNRYAAEDQRLRVVLPGTNLGFAAGNNLAAREAKGEILVLLNADTVVTSGWLPRLLRPLAEARVGIASAVTNFSGNETRIDAHYGDQAEMEEFARGLAVERFGATVDLEMVPLLCAALRRTVWAEIGELDERFGAGMFEDDDYCLRLRRAGYRITVAEDCFLHHFGNGSFGRLPSEESVRLFEKNRRYFEGKWSLTWSGHRSRDGVKPSEPSDRIPPARFFRKREASRKTPSRLLLTRLIPDATAVRRPVNRQPDGSSALLVECRNAVPGTTIRFGGVPLPTTYGNEGCLSALLPAGFHSAPARIPVDLMNGPKDSNTLYFTVTD